MVRTKVTIGCFVIIVALLPISSSADLEAGSCGRCSEEHSVSLGLGLPNAILE